MDIKKILAAVMIYLKKPLITGILGLVIGLIIGLPVLGWGLFPVKWKDASPYHLRQDLKEDYVRMSIEAFALDRDSHLALTRWKELGKGADDILRLVQADPSLKAEDVANFSILVGVAITPVSQLPTSMASQPTEQLAPVTITPAVEKGKAKFNPVYLLAVLCILLLAVGGALVYILVLRKRPQSMLTGAKHTSESELSPKTPRYSDADEDTPIAQFMTTYVLNDDLYDDSFSIDSSTGEFLGECGVGISETIGVGEPKKITAFEVWLFDKNDIQTVTKVLMSDHAFNEPTINQRLVSKGEPIILEQGKTILLETATLQLEARVIDLVYGKGALPDNSYFERLTLELAVWPKAGI